MKASQWYETRSGERVYLTRRITQHEGYWAFRRPDGSRGVMLCEDEIARAVLHAPGKKYDGATILGPMDYKPRRTAERAQ